ncbi:MAG: hypothetical protein HFI55_00235 [Lachnospiraceae bacterium]|jgi:hypothetical protein|nr:hypothetical protein [Lachnospiraceae bacterium]
MGKDEKQFRSRLIAGVFSLLFSAAILFGARLDSVENVDVGDAALWIQLVTFAVLFTGMVCLLWRLLDSSVKRRPKGERRISQIITAVAEKIGGYEDILSFLFLLLCWLPVFLAVYPGFFVYDAQDEYIQVATRVFSTHHPLVHVLLLGGMICGVHKLTDSYNLGIACYMVFQMVLAAGIFTFLFSYLRKKGVTRVLRIIGVVWLGLFPTVVMFTLCSAKDALFTLALLLLLVCLLEMGTEAAFFESKGWQSLFVVSGMGMMLLRNNGFYAFLVMIPVLLLLQKKRRWRLLFLAVCAVAGCMLVNGGLKAALHADDSEYQELLTVPIQQLARTYKYAPEVFSGEDREVLYEILDEEALSLYTPRLSDPVKYRFANETFARDKGKYAKLWLRVGLKKPLIYLNAWWMTSYGFWYPDTVINVYGGNTVFTFTYKDNSYFGYEVEQPGVRESKIPWLDEVYRKLSLEVWKEKVPVVSWLFSPGAMFWLYAFLFAWLLSRGRYELLYPFLPIFLIWLTVLLGPTYLPRYVLFFWYALPLFLAVAQMGMRPH